MSQMRIHVLGAAAGGGFPQWNCGCENCRGVREGTIKATPRTQASVAISTDEENWFVVHASPDIRAQITAFAPLHPRGLRHSPIAGILLTNADLDQTLGLLTLRESQPLYVYATEAVRHAFMDGNRFYRALSQMVDQVIWHELKLECPQPLLLPDGSSSLLAVTALPVSGKVPLYLEGSCHPQTEDNVALLFTEESDGRSFAYAPCVGRSCPTVDRVLHNGDCLLFDGTFWSDDELPRLGIGRCKARDMAHWPLGGADGSLQAIRRSKTAKRILIHINNTNPIFLEDSLERLEVNRAGIEVAYDGLEVHV